MDMSQYRDLFVSESRAHLASFSELIVRLEDTPGDPATINELFRHAHSLKGMAATMGYEHIVVIAHAMENQLSLVRSGEIQLLPLLADLLLEGGDALGRMVAGVESDSPVIEDTGNLLGRLEKYDPSAATPAASPQPAVDKSGKKTASEAPPHSQTDSFKSIRIKTETLDHLVNITGELITNRYRLAEAINLASASECREPLRQLTTLLRSLRDEVFKARMLPFAFIAERFPRLVRDLARKQGKEIRFQLTGKEIELDRGILEEITEPIVHILRNAVDHGLEMPEERALAGKPSAGSINLTVSRDKDQIEIVIADDGRGMNPERLKQKAVEKGLISPEESARMTAQEACQLVCKPGFSTAETVTDISGRGVGMDAVREAVHALSGVLTIQSESGEGSRFVMRLPITVSIIHALIVRSGSMEMAFPLNAVTRTTELRRSEICLEAGRSSMILNGAHLPLFALRQVLKQQGATETGDELLQVIICDVGGAQLAFTVDQIIGQQEIFVRPLRSPLSQLPGISGATITGDGRVLFVVDVAALV